jgi:hypothetical protein
MSRLARLAPLLVALLASTPAWAGVPAQLPRITIPALPRAGETFGLLVVGAPTAAALAARDVVRVALESFGQHVIVLPTASAPPQRADVLKLCAERTLDGVAFVKISTVAPQVRVELEVRDQNGDLFRQVETTEDLGGTPRERTSQASFTLPDGPGPAPRMEGSEAAPPATPPSPPPALLWFEPDGRAVLGDLRLADGEVYRVLGRPDLQARRDERLARKTALKVLGGVALGIGLLAATPAMIAVALCTHDCAKAEVFLIGAATLADGGITALVVGALTNADPVRPGERLDLALGYNRARLQGRPPLSSVSLSFAPSPAGDGGLVGLSGRF